MRTFKQQVEGFLDNADVMEKSKRLYRTALNKFQRWVVEEGLNIHALKRKDILVYKLYLEKSNIAGATIELYLLVLRTFYHYLMDCGESSNIAKDIRFKHKRNTYTKEYLTDDECSRLLESVDQSTEAGQRNFAIIYLMMSTGLRCIEVSRLLVGDVFTSAGHHYLMIQRKREMRKDTKFGIPVEVLKPIRVYMKNRPGATDDEPLFASREKHGIRPMSPQRIGEVVKEYLVKSGVYSKTKTTHSLRHTAAVRALKDHVSIYDVKCMLGHSEVKTTERYLASIEAEVTERNPAIRPFSLNALKLK